MAKYGWIAIGVLAFAPAISRANFLISHTRADGTGALTGYSIYNFYAKNTQSGQHPTSTKLAGVDLKVESLGAPFKFEFIDMDLDGRNDVNLQGMNMTDAAPTGTFMRIGNYGDQGIPVITVPNTAKLLSTATYDAVAYYNGRTDFRLAMVNLPAGRPNATTGVGARFAVVVVPTASGVRLSGEIADEIGVTGVADSANDAAGDTMVLPDTSADFGTTGYFQVPEYIALAPEPGVLALLGVATVGLYRRSRRASV